MGIFDFLFGKEEVIGGEEPKRKNGLNIEIVKKEDVIESIDLNTEGDFLLTVQDVFTITGRGTVITGQVERGSIKVGDSVKIKNSMTGEVKLSVVTGIEMFRKLLDTATVGDNVGILLRGIKRNEISRGDILFLGEIE